MTRKSTKSLLATGFILILAIPTWAAEEKKCGPGAKRDELIEKVQKALSKDMIPKASMANVETRP
jgi:hypothetical protein